MFDVFVGEVHCPGCGSAMRANIQTYVRADDADGSSLVVGTSLDPKQLTSGRLVRLAYTQIAEPKDGTIRILDVWPCTQCNTDQWAMTTITDARVQSIEAVKLTQPIFERANFISDINGDILAEAISKEPGMPTVEVLRKNLPPG